MANEEVKIEEPVVEAEVKQTEGSPDEQEAVSKGWKPKDQWIADGGVEEDWKPAKVFNEVGHLKDRLVEREREAKKLNKMVMLMKEHHLAVRKTAYDDALITLRNERKVALKDERFADAEELRDKIDDLRDRFSNDQQLPATVEKTIQEETKEPDPAFYEFVDRNPWYKPGGKDELSKKADALGWAYHQENPDKTFKEVILQVEKDIKKLFPEKFSTPRSPVNDSGTRGSSSKGGEKANLSDEELAIAKGFDMTPEQYAKELKSYKGR